jgi:hypothetical protein
MKLDWRLHATCREVFRSAASRYPVDESEPAGRSLPRERRWRSFLPLLEKKVGALDQAAPLQGWDLPEEFVPLRRLLEARMGKAAKREYVQILRLIETFEMDDVHGAVRQALDLGAIGYDAVKHLVLCRIERRPPRLDLDLYPYLPRARDETTKPSSYLSLMSGTAA